MTVAATGLKRKESDVYDRQIRLWGAEAQAKMAKSNVLYIHITGVSSEILKNLVLAGISAVLCDDRPFPDALLSTPSFFIDREDRKKKAKRTVAEVVRTKVEELNPLLGDCPVVSMSELTDDFLKDFSIVVCSRMGSLKEAIRISNATVANGGKFYMVDTFGFSGASVFDLGSNHTYRPEMGKKLLPEVGLKEHLPLETVLQEIPLDHATNRFHKSPPAQWVQYRCLLEYIETKGEWPSAETAADFVEFCTEWIQKSAPSLLDTHPSLTETALLNLARTATSEIAPVCSVVGGILGNEIIKAISSKGEPANNTILFDGVSCKLWEFLVKPKA